MKQLLFVLLCTTLNAGGSCSSLSKPEQKLSAPLDDEDKQEMARVFVRKLTRTERRKRIKIPVTRDLSKH